MPSWEPPTLMGAILKRRIKKIYDDGGWGPQLTFEARRADGTRLFIQFRLPKTVEFDQRESDAVASGEIVGAGEQLASMTVSFEDGKVKKPEDFPDPADPGVEQVVTTPSDRVVVVMRISEDPRLELIYMLRSQFGALTFAFITENEQMFGPQAREILRKIVETSWIGTKKRPY